MSLVSRRLWHRVFIAGTRVDILGEVVQNESLDQMTTVCEFELVSTPVTEPTQGQTVRVEWLDIDNDLMLVQFSGTIDQIEVDSNPYRLVIRATDQLALLRKARTGADLDLTTMTDGEAWEAIATDCGISFTPADIQDAGYVLGAQEPVAWHSNTPGSQPIQALDNLLAMSTLAVYNDRVVRFAYDLAPTDATGLTHTFTHGVDAYFFGNERRLGGRDQIQNVWVAHGVSAACGDADECTCTPWARAVADNPQLGSRVRVTRQTVTSDFLQDTRIAELVARRQMRWYNRVPDEISIATANDPTLRPGHKIRAINPLYSFNLGGSGRYYTVTSVSRQGQAMTLTCIGGAPGTEGTVTSGVDKTCNDSHPSGPSWPGDLGWDLPVFDFPPIDLGASLEFDLDYPFDFGGEIEFPIETEGGVGTITASAVDDTEALIPGACFEVANADFGINVQTCDGDGGDTLDGSVTFEDLPAGDWTVTITSAPSGYSISGSDTTPVTLESGESPSVPFTVTLGALFVPGSWAVEGTISISSGSGDISLDGGIGSGWAWLDDGVLGSGGEPNTFILTGVVTVSDGSSGIDFGITNVPLTVANVWCFALFGHTESIVGTNDGDSVGNGLTSGGEAFTLTWNGSTIRLQIPGRSVDISTPDPVSGGSGPWYFYWIPGGSPTVSFTDMEITLT